MEAIVQLFTMYNKFTWEISTERGKKAIQNAFGNKGRQR